MITPRVESMLNDLESAITDHAEMRVDAVRIGLENLSGQQKMILSLMDLSIKGMLRSLAEVATIDGCQHETRRWLKDLETRLNAEIQEVCDCDDCRASRKKFDA